VTYELFWRIWVKTTRQQSQEVSKRTAKDEIRNTCYTNLQVFGVQTKAKLAGVLSCVALLAQEFERTREDAAQVTSEVLRVKKEKLHEVLIEIAPSNTQATQHVQEKKPHVLYVFNARHPLNSTSVGGSLISNLTKGLKNCKKQEGKFMN
jgi:N-methylhydantoinase A/oxoprolinase/acetone carboxylase beta subunit